jgi:hypothetical protein
MDSSKSATEKESSKEKSDRQGQNEVSHCPKTSLSSVLFGFYRGMPPMLNGVFALAFQ